MKFIFFHFIRFVKAPCFWSSTLRSLLEEIILYILYIMQMKLFCLDYNCFNVA